MWKMWLIGGTALALLPEQALAQESSKPEWRGEFEIDFAPTLGKDLPIVSSGQDRDYSDYQADLTVTRTRALFGQDLSLRVNTTYDPDQFGDELESRIQADFTIGKQKYAAHRGRIFSRDVGSTDDVWQPWATVSLAKVWDGTFSGVSHIDKTATLGLGYVDVLTTVPDGESRAKGTRYSITATVSRLWSTRLSEGRWAPKVTFALYSPPLGKAARLFGRADYEARLYDRAVLPMVDHRVDHRLKLTAGVDLADWFGGTVDTFEIAGLYFRRWSNVPGYSFERAYFAPSLTLIKGF